MPQRRGAGLAHLNNQTDASKPPQNLLAGPALTPRSRGWLGPSGILKRGPHLVFPGALQGPRAQPQLRAPSCRGKAEPRVRTFSDSHHRPEQTDVGMVIGQELQANS